MFTLVNHRRPGYGTQRPMASEPRVLVPLRQVELEFVANLPTPSQKIRSEEDVHAWRLTRGYQDYSLFLRRLNESVVGRYLPWTSLTSYPVSSFFNYTNDVRSRLTVGDRP